MVCTRSRFRWPLLGVAWLSLALTGCSSLDLPNLPIRARTASDFKPVDSGIQLQGSASEEAYHSVRQAKSQNAIVLQVVGDSTPVRVLPLPVGKSVYVSDLLTQTGVAKKLGNLQATLFRDSSGVINGLPMEVRFAADGQTVRPESDYALRPGDRLQVQKAPNPALRGLLSTVLGI